ncbi:MAG: trigger factor [Elusimicrobiota bacterium]
MDELKYDIVNKSACMCDVAIEVPWKKVESELEKVYREMRGEISFPGFRKGKAPMNMVKDRYSELAKQEMLERVSPDILREVLEKENIYPAVTPSITDFELKEGTPFKLNVRIEYSPEITPKKYKKLKIVKKDRKIKEKDIQKTVKGLKEQNQRLEPKKGAAKIGDYALIEFSAQRDSNEIKFPRGNKRFLALGENNFLPDFDKNVIGMKKGDTKECEYRFPEDYERTALQKEKAVFRIELKELKKKVLPSDKEVAEAMGLKSKEELRKMVRESMQNQLDSSIEKQMENDIIEQLLEYNDFEVPPSLVKQRAESMYKKMENYIENKGGDVSEIDRGKINEKVEKEIKAGMLLGAIARKEKIEVNDEDLKEQRKYIAGQISSENPEDIEKHINREAILTKKVFDFIKENAKIKEKEGKK